MPSKPTTVRLADPGAMLTSTHELESGIRVRLRLTRPSDAPRVREFLEALSPETREQRFLAAMPRVPDATVRHFTFYDPRQRLVIVATCPTDGRERFAGLADVTLLATGLAELGLLVDDAHQNRGIGRLMSEAIATLALQRGATHLKVEVAEPNPAMLHLMRRLGPTVKVLEDGRAVAYTKLPALARRPAA
jgi:GNAT superfamily N-acetyltransferase